MTPERMRAGAKATRNPFLKDVMGEYGDREHVRMGVPHKIVRSMNEHNQTSPDLIEEGERFRVCLVA